MNKFNWNLDSTVNMNGVSYTITIPPGTSYVYAYDPLVDVYKIDNIVDSMNEFPQVRDIITKIK